VIIPPGLARVTGRTIRTTEHGRPDGEAGIDTEERLFEFDQPSIKEAPRSLAVA
jgi:hypothetical protein